MNAFISGLTSTPAAGAAAAGAAFTAGGAGVPA